MPIFGNKPKSPLDYVRSLKENLIVLEKKDKKGEKVFFNLKLFYHNNFRHNYSFGA